MHELSFAAPLNLLEMLPYVQSISRMRILADARAMPGICLA